MFSPSPATDTGVQLLGLTRFRVPPTGAFKLAHDRIETWRNGLFDPASTANRFARFVQLTRAGSAARKDRSFGLSVQIKLPPGAPGHTARIEDATPTWALRRQFCTDTPASAGAHGPGRGGQKAGSAHER